MKRLGQQIRRLRTEYRGVGMTQAELAKRAGLSWNFIAKVEAGDRVPSLSSLARIAQVLGAKVRLGLGKEQPQHTGRTPNVRQSSTTERSLLDLRRSSRPKKGEASGRWPSQPESRRAGRGDHCREARERGSLGIRS